MSIDWDRREVSNTERIGRVLRQYRLLCGLSLRDVVRSESFANAVARIDGVNATDVELSQLERGKHSVELSAGQVFALCRAVAIASHEG